MGALSGILRSGNGTPRTAALRAAKKRSRKKTRHAAWFF
jgi:hypothetical protein